MLGVVLCSPRPKPNWFFLQYPSLPLSHYHRLSSSISLLPGSAQPRRHPGACGFPAIHHGACGEGLSHARPARWLHRQDSSWLLFGVYACLAAPGEFADVDTTDVGHTIGNGDKGDVEDLAAKYTVTGVKADGRCLFRAIAHVACLRNGEEVPNDNRQTELADDLRAQVVDELVKRREEMEWFVEEDFDIYINRIRQPYVWGGEPELLMASHVLKTPISVFRVDKGMGSLTKIADYGEEYQQNEKNPITILFHRYGHYDILEAVPDQNNKSKTIGP